MKKQMILEDNMQKFLKWGVDMFYSDDPLADFHKYDAQKEKQLDKLPRCSECDNPIQDDVYFLINDMPICSDCLNDNYKKRVDDFVS